MNVIVSNKNQGLLNSLDIDVIKSINGEFTADEIIGTFSNFFFNRMFLDITAVKDYMDISNIQKLSRPRYINDKNFWQKSPFLPMDVLRFPFILRLRILCGNADRHCTEY